MAAMDMLSRLSHDADVEVAQNAVLALGMVGAGTNNARLAGGSVGVLGGCVCGSACVGQCACMGVHMGDAVYVYSVVKGFSCRCVVFTLESTNQPLSSSHALRTPPYQASSP